MQISAPTTLALTMLRSSLASLAGLPPLDALAKLVQRGHARLALPGRGATLARWQALAAVGAHDLPLAKVFEGHTDAVAILHEARAHALADMPHATWGTWCAEPPDARLALLPVAHGHILRGRKAWCSGAHGLTHAVVSCWDPDGAPMLAAVALHQRGVRVTDDGWNAVGMRATASVDVWFDDVVATPLAGPGFYVERAGFWHGGAGVAACWFGAATRLADGLRERLAERSDPHRLAQLGEVTVALQGCAALMREAAAAIDSAPEANAMRSAMTVRLSAEATANTVLHAVGRALGAGPLCKDAALAQLYADLPVFLRQSHAERDLETVGKLVAALEDAPWNL
ncbi:alkylation response protein AidB-like acyl-CoA dehydrogenase [Massilia sp. MP_M2]|uniref:acyl-CoA dehydrogenase n=1 Tax=Massilia sp. MP_M2 TaxID=3071713 RepID=UPI00319E1C5A